MIVLVEVDVFAGGVFLWEDGGAALHIDFIVVPGGVFMDGLPELVEGFFVPGDVTESFFLFFDFLSRVGDEVGFEGVAGKYFFV